VKRLRIGVIYGGRSGEHEVSLASAGAIFANLDRDRYDPVPIKIERDGHWILPDQPPSSESAADTIAQGRAAPRSPQQSSQEIHPIATPGTETMLVLEPGIATTDGPQSHVPVLLSTLTLDMVFPIVHGPYGEDGTLQGLFELANIPYVGAGVLASAVGMDKALMKVVFSEKGLPIVNHETVERPEWQKPSSDVLSRVMDNLKFPLFVKPANQGSSLGISRVTNATSLSAAIDYAARYDRKIIVEEGVTPCREIECAIIGNDIPEASVPGEIITSRDFYDYEAKYLDNRSEVAIPAALSSTELKNITKLAIKAFQSVDCAGMARVDFLVNSDNGQVFVNEINTHPGFTTISMFAKMWNASGVGYSALLDRLIALAFQRHTEKQKIVSTTT
tara:strand:+ start:760 stop:1929 length:1170 start_codon:yes stop_codon:yes gene_type:complete